MPAPRVYNKHHGDAPADAVYIGRGSPWGNPYVIDKDGDREQVCNRFEMAWLPALDVTPLAGRDLVCFCAPHRCQFFLSFFIFHLLGGVFNPPLSAASKRS